MTAPDPASAQHPISAVETAELDVAALVAEPPGEPADAELFFNRELSWVDFNRRVLELAEDPSVPLMERLKFAAIYCSNLDEFFMIRVAGLHDQVDAGVNKRLYDGRTSDETINALRERLLALGARHTRAVMGELLPALAEHGVRIVDYDDVSDQDRQQLTERYRRQIFPVLTPLAVGLGRPFPYISNLSLSLAVLVRDPVTGHRTFARVKVPKELLPRFVELEGDGVDRVFVLDEAQIGRAHV